jgi:hypothetical protein
MKQFIDTIIDWNTWTGMAFYDIKPYQSRCLFPRLTFSRVLVLQVNLHVVLNYSLAYVINFLTI